jgi:DNA primase
VQPIAEANSAALPDDVGNSSAPAIASAPIVAPIAPVVDEPMAEAVQPLAASPALTAGAEDLPIERRGEDIFITFGDRSYRVRGMKKNTSFDSLRINVMLTRTSVGAVYLDTVDLAVARQRTMFEKQAAHEIGVKEEVIHREMGRILCALERERDREIERAREPKSKVAEMTPDQRAAALAYLTAPNLLGRIVEDLTRCGLVGESTNKLLAYLAATSRKLDRPLAIIIQSSSAAGKTALMDAVLACMPAEEVIRYSAITGKALFYISDPGALKHKVLAISEEQGAEQATYALKLLQSEGKLSIASTGKDPHSGRLESQEYHVEGPIMPIMTTTAPEVDEELQNRCIVLTADEDRQQTRAIHQLQRASQTIEGLIAAREANGIQELHQNAQRLLRTVLVANPHAEALTFLDAKTRTRRDHMKYLMLIRTITLLHQYQREHRVRTLPNGERIEYIEATFEDVAAANELAHEVLGRSLDELAPQTRKLLNQLVTMVAAACERMAIQQPEYRFWQRDVRDYTGWPDYQVKLHMRKLVDMEYVLLHRGGRGQSFVYELLYRGEGDRGGAFLMGLVQVETLRGTTADRDSSPAHRDAAKPNRKRAGAAAEQPRESGGATAGIDGNVSVDAASVASEPLNEESNRFSAPETKSKSYRLRRSSGNGRDHASVPRVAMERE